MSITLKPKENNQNSDSIGGAKEKGSFSEFAFFIAINIIVVPISAYQTFVGYKVDVASNIIVAIGIAAFSAILFAAMNFGIRERRLSGKPHGLQVLMYIIPLGISFAGNFNAFYTEQMKRSLFENEVAEYEKKLEFTKNNALVALNEFSGLDQFKADFDRLSGIMESESKPENGYFGDNAKNYYDSLIDLVGNPTFSEQMNPMKKDKSKRLEKAISNLEDPKNVMIANLEAKLNGVDVFIDTSYNSLIKEIESLKKEGKLDQEGEFVVDKIRKLNNKFISETESLVGEFYYKDMEVSEKNEMGTVKYAFTSGFIDMPDKSATIFSIFLSLILDLAALLYILFFVKNGKQKVQGRVSSGPRSIN